MGVFYTKLFRKEIVGTLHLKKGNTFMFQKYFMQGKLTALKIFLKVEIFKKAILKLESQMFDL